MLVDLAPWPRRLELLVKVSVYEHKLGLTTCPMYPDAMKFRYHLRDRPKELADK
jgi:hypothetical protein